MAQQGRERWRGKVSGETRRRKIPEPERRRLLRSLFDTHRGESRQREGKRKKKGCWDAEALKQAIGWKTFSVAHTEQRRGEEKNCTRRGRAWNGVVKPAECFFVCLREWHKKWHTMRICRTFPLFSHRRPYSCCCCSTCTPKWRRAGEKKNIKKLRSVEKKVWKMSINSRRSELSSVNFCRDAQRVKSTNDQ